MQESYGKKNTKPIQQPAKNGQNKPDFYKAEVLALMWLKKYWTKFKQTIDDNNKL